MKNILIVSILMMMGCAAYQPYYPSTRVINNNTQLHNLLRNDFDFRYDFSQFNQTLPISWHYSNRFFGSNNFNGYFSYNNRHQFWNDWVWGYPFNNGIGFTYNWRNRRWSSNSYRYWYRYNNPYFQPTRTNVTPPRRRNTSIRSTRSINTVPRVRSTITPPRRSNTIKTPPKKISKPRVIKTRIPAMIKSTRIIRSRRKTNKN